MKILYIVDNYYPHIGGAELLFQQLAEGMVKAGNTVTVLAPKNFPTYKDEEVYNGVHIIRQRVPSFAQRYFFTFLSILSAIALAKKHDIIHTATYNSIFPAWLASKLTGKKAVLTVFEVWDRKWYNLSGQSRFKASLFRFIERILLSFRFNQVVCISDSTLTDYQRLFPSPSVQRIYPGVDYNALRSLKLSEEEKATFRQQRAWKDNDYIVLGFGRPGISKGFDILVDAVPEVLSTMPDVQFKFIWPSAPNFISLRDSLINRLKSFKHDTSIEVLDKQSRADLFAYIQSVDCVVIPSLAEGFGYAAIEACMLAKQVVATSAGSIPEVVSGHVVLVEAGSSSALAKGIIDLRKNKPNPMPVKLFTDETALRLHKQLYEGLINKPQISLSGVSL